MNNFGIVTINYKRPQIFELWVASIRRLRTLVGFFPVVCVSELEDQNMCLRNDIHFIRRQNKPVSRKWNVGLQWLETQGVDYAMIVGSDDIISDDLLISLIRGMDKGSDLIGIKDIYFFGTVGVFKNHLYYIKREHFLGVCKTIHRRVLDEVGWQPFTQDRNFGIDGMASRAIAPYVKSSFTADGACVDVKGAESMNRINFWAQKIKKPCDRTIFFNFLSDDEKKILNNILL